MSEAAGTLAGGSGLSKEQMFVRHRLESEEEQLLEATLTDDGEVEGSLTEAKAVPQFDGVTSTMFLLSTADRQFTAGVTALNGDIFCSFLDLHTARKHLLVQMLTTVFIVHK